MCTMAVSLPRRPTLFEQINNISATANNDYVLELMKELNDLNYEAVEFLRYIGDGDASGRRAPAVMRSKRPR